MREILFRGKDKYIGKWVYGFYYFKRGRYAGDKTFVYEKHTITTGIEETRGAYGETTNAVEYDVIPETVGQYTGLTDKNGNTIFEGDIISIPFEEDRSPWEENCIYHENGKVYFDAEHYGWYVAFFDGEALSLWEYDDLDIVVIGNIHDNPELLSGNTDVLS